jgi:hypothetical protein
VWDCKNPKVTFKVQWLGDIIYQCLMLIFWNNKGITNIKKYNRRSKMDTMAIVIGSLIGGAIFGAVPLAVGFKKEKRGLAIAGFITCIVGSFLLGMLLSVPACIIFTVIIVAIKDNPAQQNRYSGGQYTYTGTQNTYTGAQNTYTGTQNTYTGAQNTYTGTQNTYTGAQNTYAGTQNTYEGSQYKKCIQCGNLMNKDMVYCGKCGAKQTPEVQPGYCPSCGKELQEGTIFCNNCGAKTK